MPVAGQPEELDTGRKTTVTALAQQAAFAVEGLIIIEKFARPQGEGTSFFSGRLRQNASLGVRLACAVAAGCTADLRFGLKKLAGGDTSPVPMSFLTAISIDYLHAVSASPPRFGCVEVLASAAVQAVLHSSCRSESSAGSSSESAGRTVTQAAGRLAARLAARGGRHFHNLAWMVAAAEFSAAHLQARDSQPATGTAGGSSESPSPLPQASFAYSFALLGLAVEARPALLCAIPAGICCDLLRGLEATLDSEALGSRRRNSDAAEADSPAPVRPQHGDHPEAEPQTNTAEAEGAGVYDMMWRLREQLTGRLTCAACGRSGQQQPQEGGAATGDSGAGKLRACGRCQCAWYCSRGCQERAWPAHMQTCRGPC